MNIIIFIKFIVALLLGSAIGLERETTSCGKKKELWTLGGVRTFALISFIGAISGFFYSNHNAGLSFLLAIFVFAAILIFYFVTSSKSNNTGLTTEISALITYLIGFLITTSFVDIQVVIALSVVLILILSHKTQTKKFVLNLDRAELNSFISFGIVALVILPFLPDMSILLSHFGDIAKLPYLERFSHIEIINPYRLWLIVVLISGFSLLNYSLRKKIGHKNGLYFGSFFSGHISSTLTNQVLTLKSKAESKTSQLNFATANVLAYISSMTHFAILIFVLNFKLFLMIFPVLLSIFLVSSFFAWYWNKQSKKQPDKEIEIPEKETPKIFLTQAIVFALLITFVKIITQMGLVAFGQKGFAITASLSSLVGTDAAIINISELAGKTITLNYAIFVALLVNFVNLLGKWIFSKIKGNKEFAKLNLIYSSAVVLVSFVVYFLLTIK